jgi:hypothetical protein
MERAARIAISEVAAGLANNPAITRAIFALRGDDAFRIHSEVQRENNHEVG